MCFKLPEGMSTKEGALIEPFAVGLHAAHQGKVGMGDQCIILGSGCIGLMTLLACKACGATDITVVDMAQKRNEAGRNQSNQCEGKGCAEGSRSIYKRRRD